MPSTVTSDQISHVYDYAWTGVAGDSASTLTRDGVEVRRNLAKNPSFESATANMHWSTPSTKITYTRFTTAAHTGQACTRVEFTAAPSSFNSVVYYYVDGLAPDTDYVASLWVSIPVAIPAGFTISVNPGTDTAQNIVIPIGPAAIPGWQRIVVPFHSEAISSTLTITIAAPSSGGNVSAVLYVDDILVETGGVELPYFDGDTADYVEYENTHPLVVNGWEETATGLNVVNPVVGGDFDVTLRGTTKRQGAFELVYENEDEEAAAAAFAMHQRPSTFTITDSDRASIAMRYVVDGQVSRALDEDCIYWLVRVEYQEV